MNMSQEEFNSKIYDVIKDKAFISNGSGVLVEVVKKLPEQIEEGKVLFDGIMLFDGIDGIEDDIQQMHSTLKTATLSTLRTTTRTTAPSMMTAGTAFWRHWSAL